MIVLHAIWENNQSNALYVWAETSSIAFVGNAPRGRKSSTAVAEKIRVHPYNLPSATLQEEIGNLVSSLLVSSTRQGTLSLRLPTSTKGPLPSPELLAEADKQAQTVQLQAWDVSSLIFDPGQALDFLLALPTSPSPGIVFGSSLRFWIEAAQFALELLTRQCFIPAVHENNSDNTSTLCATWEAVLLPEDVPRFRRLVQCMPPVCWSFLPVGARPHGFLQDSVLNFLSRTINAFVRESLAQSTLKPFTRRTRRSGTAQLPEKWLRALTSSEATLVGTTQEISTFVALLRGWLDQIQPVAADSAFRTCFKLEAPETQEQETTQWQLSFSLQANDDRSLLIPAEQVWQERSSTLTFLMRKFESPQERLLADLGKAARLFPLLDESLQSAHPQSLALDAAQAYQFLREIAPLLESSGFGVLVPPWWQKASARLGVKLKVRAKTEAKESLGLMGLNSIVDYDWNVAIGDSELTMNEFQHLVKLKQPLVNVRGQWVELRADEIEKAIAFFQKKQAKKAMTLGEVLRVGLAQEQSDLGLTVLGVEAEGWIKDVLDRMNQRVQLTQIEVPATFQGKLRPYQLKGVSWLAFLKQFGFGSCLADDMGMGKTPSLIALLLYDRAQKPALSVECPTLVICPMSIVGNWQRELQRFAPSLSVMVHHGLERLAGEEFQQEALQHAVVITTYALALRDREHLSQIEWENVVIDEAQNIKNESAKQTQAIKHLNARYRIALTGTPVENRLSELWSIMEFLNPGYLGSATDFRKSFALPIERYRNIERAGMLKQLIQPFVLRRLKTDKEIIQDLPEKMEMKVYCNLTQEQASLYEAVVKEMLEKIEHAEPMARRGLILATLMKLKQICNHPAHFMSDSSSLPRRSGKLVRLEEMLEEVLAEGDKALIFTQFAEMGMLLRYYLQDTLGSETLFLHGGTPKKQRDLLVQRFQEERHGAQIFILSLKAGGVGLNLTGANHVFHFDRWWNPAVEDQATDRAFRIGQQKNVQVHKFVCIGTLEERIDQMIEQKKELAASIVGSGEGWITEMSTDQLKELFTLSREAIGEE